MVAGIVDPPGSAPDPRRRRLGRASHRRVEGRASCRRSRMVEHAISERNRRQLRSSRRTPAPPPSEGIYDRAAHELRPGWKAMASTDRSSNEAVLELLAAGIERDIAARDNVVLGLYAEALVALTLRGGLAAHRWEVWDCVGPDEGRIQVKTSTGMGSARERMELRASPAGEVSSRARAGSLRRTSSSRPSNGTPMFGSSLGSTGSTRSTTMPGLSSSCRATPCRDLVRSRRARRVISNSDITLCPSRASQLSTNVYAPRRHREACAEQSRLRYGIGRSHSTGRVPAVQDAASRDCPRCSRPVPSDPVRCSLSAVRLARHDEARDGLRSNGTVSSGGHPFHR